MKKIYTLIAVLIVSFSVKAQLTQSNHAPTAGDNYDMWQCDSIAPGAAGANTVWTFTSLTTHSNIVRSYTASASTNTNYPGASVSVASASNSIQYYSSSTSSLSFYGGNISVGSGLTAVIGTLTYTAPAISASYPMSLNTTGSAAVSGSLNVTSPATASGTFSGSSTVLADGTGTVILPGTTGTFTNVIRVVTSQTINFTTNLASGSLNEITYEFYQSGVKAPILSIATATATVPFGTATQTIVTRNKNAVGISTGTVTPPPTNTTSIASYDPNSQNLIVYPNPSSSVINFSTGRADARFVYVYDITGKLVEKAALNDGKLKLDVSGYNFGLYIYSLVSDDGKKIKSGKLTVGE